MDDQSDRKTDEKPDEKSNLSANVRRARYARSQHRARQHADAHADAHDVEPHGHDGRVSNLPGVPRGDAVLISTNDALAELLAQLRAAGSFAYDSEFIGELTYVPKLCLVQVATSERVALIDPLAGVDLKPFWEII